MKKRIPKKDIARVEKSLAETERFTVLKAAE